MKLGKCGRCFWRLPACFEGIIPDAAFMVAMPLGFSHGDYPGLSPEDPFFFLEGPAYDLRKACDLAWVKSGTGTLETALLNKPMVMVYKMAALSAFLAKRLVKIPHFSLVNLLAGKKVISELIQEKAGPASLVGETMELLENPKALQAQLKAFAGIRKKISHPPKASRGAALEVLKLIGKKK